MSPALERICAMAQAMQALRDETGEVVRDDLVAAGFTRAEIEAHGPAARALLRPAPDAAGPIRGSALLSSFLPPGAPSRSHPRQMAFAEAVAFHGAVR